MPRDAVLADLKLIVRALHRDVSDLDGRLRRLEQEIRVLRDSTRDAPDLIVVAPEDRRHPLGA